MRTCSHGHQGFSLIEILVAITIMATLAASAAVLIPIGIGRANRARCVENLHELGGLYHIQRLESPGRPPHDGADLFLAWRRARVQLKFGDEELLLCPADPAARFPRTDADREAWDEETNAAALCSYAVRDFSKYPLHADDGRRSIIACDRQGLDGATPHHDGGINVLYGNGAVKWMTAELLQLPVDQPITVGPESQHELLRMVAVDVDAR